MQHISGESLPVEVAVGQEVPGGSINHDGVLFMRATAVPDSSTPARIARLAEEALVRRMGCYLKVLPRVLGGSITLFKCCVFTLKRSGKHTTTVLWTLCTYFASYRFDGWFLVRAPQKGGSTGWRCIAQHRGTKYP